MNLLDEKYILAEVARCEREGDHLAADQWRAVADDCAFHNKGDQFVFIASLFVILFATVDPLGELVYWLLSEFGESFARWLS